jgi:hypothetical protein
LGTQCYSQYIGFPIKKIEARLLAAVDESPNNAVYKKTGNVIHYTYNNDAKEDALDQTFYFDEKGRCYYK